MKKVLDLIRDHHNLIYRISLFLVAIALCVYIMPRKRSFKYEPIEGKPWPHESLISDMEFSILKSSEKIAQEQQQILDNKKSIFKLDNSRVTDAKKALDAYLINSAALLEVERAQ